jgi:hypothetical protein
MKPEAKYPDHWLLAGGPCDAPNTSWRGGMCMKCYGNDPETVNPEAKVFAQWTPETATTWLDLFAAAIEYHDLHICEFGERRPVN